MAISLFIVGDVVPKGKHLVSFLQSGDRIFQEIKPFITGADLSIVNLEAPIVKGNPTPIEKSGPNLHVTPLVVDGLKTLGFSIVTLANNHFFDQGQKGVDNTIDVCQSVGLRTVGGGRTCSEARLPLFVEKNGKRIALINACEHEFSIATSEHGGSNPLDLINIKEDISNARSKADFVVLILHGGLEMYHYPTPRMKRWYRFFVDLGADAVINHHQHCINGYEVYKGKPIFYGLGNFYFPRGSQPLTNSWLYGYAVRLVLGEGVDFEMVPYKQTEDAVILRDKVDFENEQAIYNLPIQDDFLLQQKFDDYVIDHMKVLKMSLLPSFMHSRFISMLIRRGWLGKLYGGKPVLLLKNIIGCESHYESLMRLFTMMAKQ